MSDLNLGKITKETLHLTTFSTRHLGILDMIDFSQKSFKEGDFVVDALNTLILNNQMGYPVTTENGAILGFIDLEECIKALSSIDFDEFMLVDELMRREVIVFTPTTSLFCVLEYFMKDKGHIYPIESDGIYIGYITKKNLVKVLNDSENLFL